MKVRSDAWSHEEDLLLAETVLRHIREGSTQLNAFEEVGDELNRTSAACGFRWNAEIRKHYEQAVSLAKKQRKDLKRTQANEHKLESPKVPTQKQLTHTQKSSKQEKESIPNLIHDAPSYHQEISTELVPILTKNITLDDVIAFLQNNGSLTNQNLQIENDFLKRENEQLRYRYEMLEQQCEKLQQQQNIIKEDYEAILNIMDRARKMATNEEVHHTMAPIFKMDQNGNLEIV